MSDDIMQAIEHFITHKGNAENLLKQILSLTEDHMGYDATELSWSHVGTMASVIEDLKGIAEKVGIDSEEALDSQP